MKTVIMAGGKGTRLATASGGVPKPLTPIEDVPVLEREIECLRRQGFRDLILTVSHMARQIMDYFQDGARLGVRIEYYVEETPLGNAGALFPLRDRLSDDFLLLNADVLFDVDLNRFVRFHRERGGLVTLFTHPNDHPFDSGLLITDESGAVEQWLTKEDTRPRWYHNRVNAGLHILQRRLLDDIAAHSGKADLDRDILRPLAGTGRMFCYDSPEYVRDMGTPERCEAVRRDFRAGVVAARNLRNPQRAVFLDRDGVINRYVGFLRRADEFTLLDGVADALRRIRQAGYLAIVATNQPVIARGETTFAQLDEIHRKMETLLGEQGAYLDAVYVCPHHPHGGYAGEIPALKIDCNCRKPKPGMLLRAAEKYNIDLGASWMIGDDERDIQAGQAAGCQTALVGQGDFGQDITVTSLLDFAERCLA
ncbi:MAG: HAD-IIIA family hydrolase [Oscillibacter sp.]|nr:HAD-IIIA family hydrolase [Oscillibacter sp.]